MNEATTIEINTRLIERLAEALIFAFHVPDGIQLVAVLGTGTEKDNCEAMKVWVKRNLNELDDLTGQSILHHLQSRLSNCLDDIRYYSSD